MLVRLYLLARDLIIGRSIRKVSHSVPTPTCSLTRPSTHGLQSIHLSESPTFSAVLNCPFDPKTGLPYENITPKDDNPYVLGLA